LNSANTSDQSTGSRIIIALASFRISILIIIDLSGYDIDAPLPELGTIEDPTNPRTRHNLIYNLAERENLTTLREVYEPIAGARGHWEIVGTPEQIADQWEEWFLNEGADGFNIMPPTFPEVFNDIVELVIPELQRRGLFRNEYESDTLRGNLGLSIPVNPFKKQSQIVNN
jgi:alkanesulfonate monooxygenase SsuD/methylene tetrahydromethanopterin reductase-like flavin-dependent oxidoreductase (luciferase family)